MPISSHGQDPELSFYSSPAPSSSNPVHRSSWGSLQGNSVVNFSIASLNKILAPRGVSLDLAVLLCIPTAAASAEQWRGKQELQEASSEPSSPAVPQPSAAAEVKCNDKIRGHRYPLSGRGMETEEEEEIWSPDMSVPEQSVQGVFLITEKSRHEVNTC